MKLHLFAAASALCPAFTFGFVTNSKVTTFVPSASRSGFVLYAEKEADLASKVADIVDTAKKAAVEEADLESKVAGIVDTAKSAINEVTGKEEYEVGDLSRWIDAKARKAFTDVTGKDESDIASDIEALVRETREKYSTEDVKNELIGRLKSQKFEIPDLMILCKVLLSTGIGISPIARIFPINALLGLLNASIIQEAGARAADRVGADIQKELTATLANELDRRCKDAFLGNPDAEPGDVAKKALLDFIGKDEFAAGDITKTVEELVINPGDTIKYIGGVIKAAAAAASADYMYPSPDVDPKVVEELEEAEAFAGEAEVEAEVEAEA